jgi:hypothetical protein
VFALIHTFKESCRCLCAFSLCITSGSSPYLLGRGYRLSRTRSELWKYSQDQIYNIYWTISLSTKMRCESLHWATSWSVSDMHQIIKMAVGKLCYWRWAPCRWRPNLNGIHPLCVGSSAQVYHSHRAIRQRLTVCMGTLLPRKRWSFGYRNRVLPTGPDCVHLGPRQAAHGPRPSTSIKCRCHEPHGGGIRTLFECTLPPMTPSITTMKTGFTKYTCNYSEHSIF